MKTPLTIPATDGDLETEADEIDQPRLTLRKIAKAIAKRVLPSRVLATRRRLLRTIEGIPKVGQVRFGDLRRLEPLSRCYGFDRGRPVDRYYIENFLADEGELIRGRVLEVGENTYTLKFGQDVMQSEILHVSEGFKGATYIDDLTDGWSLPSNAFDCVILTQTLHLIYDMRKALQTIYRILKPGGVLLATVPGITQIADEEWNETWYWSLSSHSAKRLLSEVFPPGGVAIGAFGNVLSATCFLQGLSETELTRDELDHFDREYPVTITIRARKGSEAMRVEMSDRWDYAAADQYAYDDETSYRKAMGFLDGRGLIEDWGCGTAFARRFVTSSEYRGVDGSPSRFADIVADLQQYRSRPACLLMRHVLEHNWGWRRILRNAVESFQDRMVLIVFTPFGESEMKLSDNDGIPDLALNKQEVLAYFEGMRVVEETFRSKTEYGEETIFYVERRSDAH